MEDFTDPDSNFNKRFKAAMTLNALKMNLSELEKISDHLNAGFLAFMKTNSLGRDHRTLQQSGNRGKNLNKIGGKILHLFISAH